MIRCCALESDSTAARSLVSIAGPPDGVAVPRESEDMPDSLHEGDPTRREGVNIWSPTPLKPPPSEKTTRWISTSIVTVCLLPGMEEQGVQFEKVVDVRYQDKLERVTVKIWHALDPTSHNRPLLHLQARSA